ncbi:SGNH/GDSL hydrolase family protein [Allokutzneria sp. A3M-2-11 16]|uniref:SGNH/GDSL hydrolase family protein n=1 Tax=Allokutzneria sp. A3M-2-11 16 TaxID=2962043 RepID=UPI0020B7A2D4|nr:SGNH/GDSL hydrolase family protein [Allokutzneria sp. A3M-2-11 16]MCP3798362.1 SGNH/GDSL hydrolase family protein [Allokutzneria sp. A3M-2-11 16]
MRLGGRIRAGLLCIATGAAVTATATPAPAQEPLEYVALGDSAAAGPLIPNQNTNLLCLRSNNNYPAIAARSLGARLTDVSCSGATTSDLTSRRFGILAPQLDSLSASTDLVTVTIGANDSGLFLHALSCVNLLPEPVGFSCADRLTAGGRDTIGEAVDAWAPKFGAALDEVRRRAPNAKVLVTGYGTYVRPNGCFPVQPVWSRDANYLQGIMDKISSKARENALARGMRFVDFAAVTVGHDICAAPKNRYLEGLVPTHIAAPLHPNAQGMAAFAKAVVAATGSRNR